MAIRLQGVAFAYGNDFALSVPELAIEAKQKVALLGPSGCGKTTLLNLLCGLLQPTHGQVQVLGRDLTELSDRQRRAFRVSQLGLVFQQFELLEYLTGWENLLLPYRINPALKLDQNVKQRAQQLVTTLGLTDKIQRRPDRLSQGEQQRVALGRALVHEPKCLLCDEPTGNLDPDSTLTALDLLFEQAERLQSTVVVVTHNHQILDRFDRVIDVGAWSQRGASV
jgi:putative ABC transport system ATP-binding protein